MAEEGIMDTSAMISLLNALLMLAVGILVKSTRDKLQALESKNGDQDDRLTSLERRTDVMEERARRMDRIDADMKDVISRLDEIKEFIARFGPTIQTIEQMIHRGDLRR